jgi:hypothetical protein
MKCLRMGVGVLLGAFVLATAVAGCSSNADSGAESQTGKVSMQLTGQTNGNSYRLRNARFDVTGPTNITLDSETDLTATTLDATLSTGSYSINLEPGWSLERSDAGMFDVVDATLTSANPRAFQILGGGTTNVAYQFSTDGTIVTIGTGDLSVSIDVTETGSGGSGGGGGTGSCSLAPQGGCPASQACYLSSDTMATGQCSPAGAVPVGGVCTQVADCAPGGVCVGTQDPTTMVISDQCFEMCDTTVAMSCTAGQSCFDLGIGGNLGICN